MSKHWYYLKLSKLADGAWPEHLQASVTAVKLPKLPNANGWRMSLSDIHHRRETLIGIASPRTEPALKRPIDLELALQKRLEGEVRLDAGSRALYATDLSIYREPPIGVVIPETTEDVVVTLEEFRKRGVPILGRPATHRYCTLGGMIGNNSCGVHSVMGRKTVDNIEELDILTYDGLQMRVGRTSDTDLERIIGQGGAMASVAANRSLTELVERCISRKFYIWP